MILSSYASYAVLVLSVVGAFTLFVLFVKYIGHKLGEANKRQIEHERLVEDVKRLKRYLFNKNAKFRYYAPPNIKDRADYIDKLLDERFPGWNKD